MSFRLGRNSGFTLVELSIVLVIVGLILAGILIAISMIETARIQSTLRQLQQFDIGVTTFQSMYKQLPGDNDFFGAAVGNEVHGDGRISEDDNTLGSGRFDAELGRFWYDLSEVGLRNPNGNGYANCAAIGACNFQPGINVPISPVGTNAVFFAATNLTNNDYFLGEALGGMSANSIDLKAALTPVEALAIDTKLDDGGPSTGNITYNSAVGTNCVTASVPNAYDVTQTKPACALLVRMGASINTAP